MGPIELADTVGLDICLSVGEVLAESLGGEVPAVLRSKVGQGCLGRKNGRGFYEYRKGKIRKTKHRQSEGLARDVRDRLILRMANEAVACLHDGVVDDADLIDVGMVFGTGFAPFRGGPLRYVNDRGIAEVHRRLEELENFYGSRFAPHPGWEALSP